MSCTKHASIVLLYLLYFSIAFFHFSYCITCPEIEKHALLSFKDSIEIPSDNNLLHSWKNHDVDCCKWEGVVCNNLTGHVYELHLQSSWDSSVLQGKLNPSLLNLKYLRYLDLRGNMFESTIPAFIGSFPNLEYLDLSYAGFRGTIPHTLGNLSNLRSLSLEQNPSPDREPSTWSLEVDNLEWLSGLYHLEHLHMNYVNLNKSINWLQVINTLPSLVELNFRGCNLELMAPLHEVNLSSLVVLDLSLNKFQYDVPKWIFQLDKLNYLNLSNNHFEGSIPTICNITELRTIDLSGNNFNSTIPDWIYIYKYSLEVFSIRNNSLQGSISHAIGNLTSLSHLDLSSNELSGEIPSEIAQMCKLKKLDLSGNKLQGKISDTFGNTSNCFLGVLEELRLNDNQLSSHLTNQFGEFKSLRVLDVRTNSLSGTIPLNLGRLLLLEELNLGDNKFTDKIPENLGQLLNLITLSISDNNLQGVVSEIHFANLTNLSIFSASGNHLRLKVDKNWIPPFKLSVLELGSWDLGAGTQIPIWLETQKDSITSLDLSNTGISQQVPNWFWEITSLNLAHNQLHGKIPDIISSGPAFVRRSIYLNSNKFNGSLPRVGNTVYKLDLSNNSISGNISDFLCNMTNEATYILEFLHLGGNRLSGELPDCWTILSRLKVLNLGSNDISGSISNSFGLLTRLRSLSLYNNSLSGQIPSSIQNFKFLLKIDLADNMFVGSIPAWKGESLPNLKILILRSNKLNGEIPSSLCQLNTLQILDLSDNMFSGKLPKCVDNFTAMATKRQFQHESGEKLHYSYYFYDRIYIESASVATKGQQLDYDNILQLVTNIDLSRNNLSGEIPMQMTSLVELRSLNLSMNHLSGTIPNGIGEMKQLESLDISRNSFSGEIPSSLAILTTLNYLNLSFNDLIGKIPESTQLQSLDASAFIGNKLCGPPLTIKCSSGGETPDEEDSRSNIQPEIDWFYIFLSLGYAVGFWAVCVTLVFNKSWRDGYFGALEDMWIKIHVYASKKLCKRRTD